DRVAERVEAGVGEDRELVVAGARPAGEADREELGCRRRPPPRRLPDAADLAAPLQQPAYRIRQHHLVLHLPHLLEGAVEGVTKGKWRFPRVGARGTTGGGEEQPEESEKRAHRRI